MPVSDPIERLPFTVLLPRDGSVIDVLDQLTNLRMAVCDSSVAADLDSSWEYPGVYMLLQRPRHDGSYGVYVGKSNSLRRRLADHAENRPFNRALVVRRSSDMGLQSTQVGWLEGDLYEMFRYARLARLENKSVPRGDTIHEHDLAVLRHLRDPVARVLQLLGHDLTVGPKPVNPADLSKVTLLDLVLAKRLHAGQVLVPAGSVDASVSATLTGGGRVVFDGQEHYYPSGAARAATGGALEDQLSGWTYWAVPTEHGQVPLAKVREHYAHGLESTLDPAPAQHLDLASEDAAQVRSTTRT